MRNLFLALVLANLGFAAWSAWFAPAQRAGRPCRRRAAEAHARQRGARRPAQQRRRRRADVRRPRAAGASPAERSAARRVARRTRASRRRSGEPVAALPPSAAVAAAAAACTAPQPRDALHERRAVSRAVASRDGGRDAAQRRLSTDAARRRRRHLDRLLGLHRRRSRPSRRRTRSSRRCAARASPTRTSFRTATAATSSRSVSSARSAASAGGASRCARSASSRKSSIARGARPCTGSTSCSPPIRRSTSTRCKRRAASFASSSAPARRRALSVAALPARSSAFLRFGARACGCAAARAVSPASIGTIAVSVMVSRPLTETHVPCASHNTRTSRSSDMRFVKQTSWTLALVRARQCVWLARERAERAGHAHGDGARVAGSSVRGQGARRRRASRSRPCSSSASRPARPCIDVIAVGGWFTEVLSAAVGPTGKVYAQNPDVLHVAAEASPRPRRRATIGSSNVTPIHGELAGREHRRQGGRCDHGAEPARHLQRPGRRGRRGRDLQGRLRRPEAGRSVRRDRPRRHRGPGQRAVPSHAACAGEDVLTKAGFTIEAESDILRESRRRSHERRARSVGRAAHRSVPDPRAQALALQAEPGPAHAPARTAHACSCTLGAARRVWLASPMRVACQSMRRVSYMKAASAANAPSAPNSSA